MINKRLYKCIFVFVLSASSVFAQQGEFCKKLPRAQYSDYTLHASSNNWFNVYEVETDIFAIYEPHQWQEVISYLIIGKRSAVLFDTGNGIGNIKAVVAKLTSLPITVINSHAHFDHVGGNYQFDRVVSIATDFTRLRSKGRSNKMVREEASSIALCRKLPTGVTEDNHNIQPFKITKVVKNGHQIDIGGRILELIQMQGHTSDSIVMLDRKAGFMWTGDTYYTGPIWLYALGTDLKAYGKTISRLAKLAKDFKILFPAHNVPKANPLELVKVRDGFEQVIKGEVKAESAGNGQVLYKFPTFSFLMRKGKIKSKGL